MLTCLENTSQSLLENFVSNSKIVFISRPVENGKNSEFKKCQVSEKLKSLCPTLPTLEKRKKEEGRYSGFQNKAHISKRTFCLQIFSEE